MVLAFIAHGATGTTGALARSAAFAGFEAVVLQPEEALGRLEPGDVALGRLDVLPSLDGVEPGLGVLGQLETRGVRVLNPPSVLLAAHDKLLTARALAGAGIPHPVTRFVARKSSPLGLDPPLVVKPRFGSWGRDVALCRDGPELERTLARLAGRAWFRSQGALVQEFVPTLGYDLRLIVAGSEVVGAVERVPASGEWRSNVALGGRRRPVDPPEHARQLALAAAGVLDADLVGVDMLPTLDGGLVVLELNAAVDFTGEYSLGRDVFADAIAALTARLYTPAREAVQDAIAVPFA